MDTNKGHAWIQSMCLGAAVAFSMVASCPVPANATDCSNSNCMEAGTATSLTIGGVEKSESLLPLESSSESSAQDNNVSDSALVSNDSPFDTGMAASDSSKEAQSPSSDDGEDINEGLDVDEDAEGQNQAGFDEAVGVTLAPEGGTGLSNDSPHAEFDEVTEEVPAVSTVQIFRLYNPNSGEHLYTESPNERDVLSRIGWVFEGGAWVSPSLSNNPVFRLYNPFSGDHHYTLSNHEYDTLSGLGWIREGVAWYGDDDEGLKLFRFFNPNVSVGTHHYTSSAEERMRMVSDGWVYEGLAWFGVDMGATAPEWTQPGWVESNGACFYANSDSTYAHGWQTIDNQKYYFDREGRKSVGATDVDGTIYDFGDDGCLKHGWRDHSGYRYYFDAASGALSKAGWLQLGNNWYYLNTTSGAMATGLRRIDGFLRYFGNDGVCDKVGYQVNWGGLRLSVNSVTLPSYTSGSFWNYVTPSRIAVDSSRSACIESFISAAYDYMNAVTRWVDNQCSRPGDTVDCSGLVMECLYACGMSLDGTSAGDFNPYSKYYWNHSFANTWRNNQIFQPISLNDVERGDIIYYNGHVAIYLGGGQIIESTSLSSNIRVGSMYNPGRPIGAARPFTK